MSETLQPNVLMLNINSLWGKQGGVACSDMSLFMNSVIVIFFFFCSTGTEIFIQLPFLLAPFNLVPPPTSLLIGHPGLFPPD